MSAKLFTQDIQLQSEDEMRPFRCNRCGRLLCFEGIVEGRVEIKCRKCKTVNNLQVTRDEGEGVVDNS